MIEILGEDGGRETLVDLVIPLYGLFEGFALEDVNNGGKCFTMDNWKEKKMNFLNSTEFKSDNFCQVQIENFENELLQGFKKD